MRILAFDPGLRYPAGAVYDNQLICAARVKLPQELQNAAIGERCRLIADLVVKWFDGFQADLFVYEWPQIYVQRMIGDPNDLLALAAVGAGVAARLGIPVCSPKPREVWGNLPKTTTGNAWHSARGHRLNLRLSAEERAKVANYHDALDAAGLALWGAGRWKARSNYPGAV